jgi:hypothetical protein
MAQVQAPKKKKKIKVRVKRRRVNSFDHQMALEHERDFYDL